MAQLGFRSNIEGEDWTKKVIEWGMSDKGKEIKAAGGNTTPVGSFPKGKCFYGCYDMAGNAYEWCSDWFKTDYYQLKAAKKKNPEGPSEEEADEVVVDNANGTKSKARLLRGGTWMGDSNICQATSRSSCSPSSRSPSSRSTRNGFRVVVLPRP